MNSPHAIYILTVLALIVNSYGLVTHVDAQTLKDSYAIQTPDQAVNRALAYTGFDKLKDFNPDKSLGEVQLVTARDSTTPFLSDSINSRTAWRVSFKDLILPLYGFKQQTIASHPKSFQILIDAETARLFEIRSVSDASREGGLCEAPAKVATEQLRYMAAEIYYGFPKEPPATSFLEALDSLSYSPLHAKFVVAQYVLYNRGGPEYQRVWTINLYGLPPIPVKYGTIDFMRCVIDAQTGQGIHDINLPSVPCDDPDWEWPGVDTLKDNEK
jgi:hypothetical protein